MKPTGLGIQDKHDGCFCQNEGGQTNLGVRALGQELGGHDPHGEQGDKAGASENKFHNEAPFE